MVNMTFYLIMIFALTFMLTWCLRRYALYRQVLDIPNERSAHTLPTPRGGGIAFVVGILVTVPYLEGAHFLAPNGSVALASAGVFIASLGFLDDHGHVPSAVRLLGHVVAGILALYWVGGMPPIAFGWITLTPGILANVFALFYLVWLLNLYNFMDGIDGLAGIEAFSVCLGMVGLYHLTGDVGLMVLPLVLASGVLGFLCWNFPSARIFMGDAGSGFLGFIFAVLSIQSAHVNPLFFWSWVIMLGVFIVDATYTLLCRMVRLEKIYQAHSMHAYQHAARRFGCHPPVTFGVLLINLAWLLPIAWCVGLGILSPVWGICMAYIPLIALVVFFKAGRES
ncbi:MAG: glycosyltransferase family 4 protein [Legionellaceae bacterium]|nr:glycosyltransferase family 4 protein [Legionellaceae bacterium]